MTQTQKLSSFLKQATAKRDEMNKYRPLSKQQAELLEQDIKIEHVWSSNAIEGSSLSRYETASIIDTGMTVHQVPIKDVLAAIDLTQAYDYMMDLAANKQPLTVSTIRDLNRLVMLKNTDDPAQAGAYRVVEVWPQGREDRHYVTPIDIALKVQNLVEWANSAVQILHPVEYAAELHYRFVTIHPFIDGNGRTARLLMNLALTEAGYPVINIQPDKTAGSEYMKALSHAQDTDDLLPFKILVAEYVNKALDKRLDILRLNQKNIEVAALETNLHKGKHHKRLER